MPYELVSLMELLRFEADAYCRLMNMTGQLLAHFTIASGPAARAGLSLTNSVFGELGSTLGEMEKLLRTLNLPLAQKHLERMRWTLENDNASLDTVSLMRNL